MIRLIIVSTYLSTIMLLGGCRVFVEPFVCVTGTCPSKEDRIATIPWSPSLLDKNSCQNLSGYYKEVGWFENNRQSRETLFKQFDFRLHGDDENSREAGIQASYQNYQEIPYDRKEIGMSYDTETKTFSKKYQHDESFFYENAAITIKQQGELFEVILIGPAGTQYKKSILNLDHPQVGCVDGALVIRTMNAFGGNEGSYGSVTAREKKYRRLGNGNLQITISTREWLFTPSSGLIGMDAQGRPFGNDPRTKEYTLTFPATAGDVPHS